MIVQHTSQYPHEKPKIRTVLIIPAYGLNGEGYKTHLKLEITPSEFMKITTIGAVAESLEKLFCRAVQIVSSLKGAWKKLHFLHYKLISVETSFRVKDVRSAGLPICLALLNILREVKGLNQVNSYVGTGVLRVDGSFEQSSFEHLKQEVIGRSYSGEKKIINSESCNHIFELELLLNRS